MDSFKIIQGNTLIVVKFETYTIDFILKPEIALQKELVENYLTTLSLDTIFWFVGPFSVRHGI